MTDHISSLAPATEQELAEVNSTLVGAVRVSELMSEYICPDWADEALKSGDIQGFYDVKADKDIARVKTPDGVVEAKQNAWILYVGDSDLRVFEPTNPDQSVTDEGQVIDVISHHFLDGVYAREMRIKDGYQVKQHAHTYSHTSLLSEGCAIVEADGNMTTYYAPSVIEIKAGVQHSVTPVNGNAHWTCVHRTSCEDVARLDEQLIEKQA